MFSKSVSMKKLEPNTVHKPGVLAQKLGGTHVAAGAPKTIATSGIVPLPESPEPARNRLLDDILRVQTTLEAVTTTVNTLSQGATECRAMNQAFEAALMTHMEEHLSTNQAMLDTTVGRIVAEVGTVQLDVALGASAIQSGVGAMQQLSGSVSDVGAQVAALRKELETSSTLVDSVCDTICEHTTGIVSDTFQDFRAAIITEMNSMRSEFERMRSFSESQSASTVMALRDYYEFKLVTARAQSDAACARLAALETQNTVLQERLDEANAVAEMHREAAESAAIEGGALRDELNTLHSKYAKVIETMDARYAEQEALHAEAIRALEMESRAKAEELSTKIAELNSEKAAAAAAAAITVTGAATAGGKPGTAKKVACEPSKDSKELARALKDIQALKDELQSSKLLSVAAKEEIDSLRAANINTTAALESKLNEMAIENKDLWSMLQESESKLQDACRAAGQLQPNTVAKESSESRVVKRRASLADARQQRRVAFTDGIVKPEAANALAELAEFSDALKQRKTNPTPVPSQP